MIAILSQGHTFARNELISQVRSVFGFNRTGPVLDEAINNAIDALLSENKLGEGALGIGLRRSGNPSESD